MASFDSLPADQKAVLSLVLQRGRSFDEIAALPSINRAAVRQRALEGADALGPETSLDPIKRGLITDYLLGQLPPRVVDTVYASLAANPPERAWTRGVAAEIAPLANHPLPEIPVADAAAPERPAARAPNADPEPENVATPLEDDELDARLSTDAPSVAAARTPTKPVAAARPSSRRGGAILLGLVALIVVAVVVVALLSGGSSNNTKKRPALTTAKVTSTTGTSGRSTTATPLHEIVMVPPTAAAKGPEGAADVVRSGGKVGIVLVADKLAPNTDNAYAVWLYDASTRASYRLGFYGAKVAASGKTKGALEAENLLPADAATKYDELLLTLETAEDPASPGPIVLEGAFAE